MKRACIVICATIMLLWSFARAHDGSPVERTCPICKTAFYVVEPNGYSLYGNSGEGGPLSYNDIFGQSIHCCPKCHYSALSNDFGAEDDRQAKQIEAVKAVLAASKYPVPPKALYPVEYFDIARQCLSLRKPKAAAMLSMHLMCAWMCDDAGEDAMATACRIKAQAACKESLDDKTLKPSDRFWRRRLQLIITYNLGKQTEALKGMTDLQAEIEQFVKARREDPPPKPDAYDANESKIPHELRDSAVKDSDDLFEGSDPVGKPLDPQAKAKLRKIRDARIELDELKSVAYSIKYRKTLWLYKTLRPTKALAMARKGRWAERYVFIELFKSSSDFRVIAGIKAFVEKPMGLEPKTLNSAQAAKWMSDEFSGRSNLKSMLYTDGTSAELREFANRENGQLYESGKHEYLPKQMMLKRASTTFLAKHLTEIQDNFVYPRATLFGSQARQDEIPADIIAELTRRNDAESRAALSGHFADNPAWYANAVPDICYRLFDKKSGDWFYDSSYYPGQPVLDTMERTTPFFQVIARDSKMATLAARRLLYRAYTDEEIDDEEGLVAIMPLGYLNNAESRKLLIEATQIDNCDISYAASVCLLLRGDPAGKDAMIDTILTYQAYDLPEGPAGEAFIGMLKPQDAKVMPKLKELFLDDDTFDAPIRMIAALARAAKEQGGVYDAFLARMTPAAKPSKNGTWRPAVVDYDWESLIQAAGMYYRPDIGKHLAQAINTLADDDITPDLIETLGTAQAVDQIPTLAELLNRPSPVHIKEALIKASRTLDIPGMSDKLIQWSRSRNEELAKFAKAEIARKGKRYKQK